MANCKGFIVVFCAGLLCVSVAQAKNLGTFGATFDIKETDLVEEIKAGIDHDKFAQAMEEYKKPYQPKDIHPLPLAAADRSFYPDMTYTLDHDIYDKDGEILYRKGLTWNPLDYTTLPGGIVIIDGGNEEQVNWYLSTPYAKNNAALLLLSGGYANVLRDQLRRPVYYLTEQIAKRLQVVAVPSIVIQEGKRMMVREVLIEK